MIRAESLSVSLGETDILHDVSLSVDDGEFVAVVGPNGAGKSVLLRTLAQMLPYRGTVALDGTNMREIKRKDLAKRIAMVSQFHDSAIQLTVNEMVLMGRTPYKSFFEGHSKEDGQLVDDALERVGLEAYKDRPLRDLSGGERQRAMVARVLVQDTDHLFLDEVTNHLDVYYQLEILSLVKRLDLAVIAVLHDINLAMAYADRIVALKDGRVLFDKRPSDIGREDLFTLYGVDCRLLDIPGESHRVVTYSKKVK